MPESFLREAESRLQLGPWQFPFESRFVEIGGARLHYVDEGAGPILVMLHGNPTWSFVYRHLIKALRNRTRCIAVDLAGFGLSDPPQDFSFLPAEQAELIAGFLDRLDIRDATLIAHDWGGPIGLAAMLRTQRRIAGLCLGNTWAWPVNGDFHFEWFSKLMGGPIGRFGTNRHAIFINGLLPASMKRRKLSDAEMHAYRAPFANGRTRRPMHVFPQQITAARDWLAELEQGVRRFEGPVRLVWPENDIAFRDKELKRWQEIFPRASIARIPQCGHFLWEDAPDDCLAAIEAWLPRS